MLNFGHLGGCQNRNKIFKLQENLFFTIDALRNGNYMNYNMVI